MHTIKSLGDIIARSGNKELIEIFALVRKHCVDKNDDFVSDKIKDCIDVCFESLESFKEAPNKLIYSALFCFMTLVMSYDDINRSSSIAFDEGTDLKIRKFFADFDGKSVDEDDSIDR